MNIDFKESQESLTSRIKIHDLYGSANLDLWMFEKLKITSGEKILDLGCGDGKQCFGLKNYLKKNFSENFIEITGIDEHENLIKIARTKNKKTKNNIKFNLASFDKKLLFPEKFFDLVISCFAIYYAENIEKTLLEIKRVLKPDGRIFFTGPMPNNKKEFNEVIEDAANDKVPELIGSSRYSTEIFESVNNIFENATIEEFKNQLNFETIEPFLEYAHSTLEKNRKVYVEFLKNKDLKLLLSKIQNILKEKIKINGKLIITKLVGGISAYNAVD